VAALIENSADLENVMGWEIPSGKNQPRQQQLFVELTDDENKVVELMKKEEKVFIDTLCRNAGMPASRMSALLLGLEFKGILEAMPGNVYRLK
jgi:DNA processing protein